MDGAKSVPLIIEKLTSESRAVFNELSSFIPNIAHSCTMDEAPYGYDLRALIPSPTGDRNLDIEVFFSEGPKDLSVGFGGWHCHEVANFFVSEFDWIDLTITETVRLIIEGKILSYSKAPKFEAEISIVYIPSQYEIDEALDAGPIRVRSWDGEMNVILEPGFRLT